jgi:hypothetical protein
VRSFATASDCSRARAAPRPTTSGKITGCSQHTGRVRVSPSASETTYSLDVLAIAAEHCASEVSPAFRRSNEHVHIAARLTTTRSLRRSRFRSSSSSRVDSLTHCHTHASRVVMWRSCSLTRCNSLCVIQCETRSSLQASLLRSLTWMASKTAETCLSEPFRIHADATPTHFLLRSRRSVRSVLDSLPRSRRVPRTRDTSRDRRIECALPWSRPKDSHHDVVAGFIDKHAY